jgi:hypothetical protein
LNLKPQIIDPTKYPDWDEILLRIPGASFFHSSAWARVLSEAYGYTPLYFTVIENGNLRALVPMMEVDSFLTGRRGVSLPFTDYCEPIVDERIQFQDLLNHIIDYGKKRGWKYLELRGGKDKLPNASNSECYLGNNLDISRKENEIFLNFRESTRRNIKKGESQGVVVQISERHAAIEEFFRLNCMTRKKHGLPPQPFHFFGKIYQYIICRGLGFVGLASHDGQNIAGAVFLHFGDKAIYKYGASDRKYQELRANNLVMWEGIKWSCNHGYKTFCFGRTELENEGLQQFKSGWGPEEHQIQYLKYDLRQGIFISNNKNPERGTRNAFLNPLFQRLPIPALNVIGSWLYRHMG